MLVNSICLNIISAYNKYKIVNKAFYILFFFPTKSLTSDGYIYSLSLFGLITSQLLNSHTWLLATALDTTDLLYLSDNAKPPKGRNKGWDMMIAQAVLGKWI